MHPNPITVRSAYHLTQAVKAGKSNALVSAMRLLGRFARAGLSGLADLPAEIARAYVMAHVLPFTPASQVGSGSRRY